MGNFPSEYLSALTFQVVEVVPKVQAVSLLGSAGDVVDFFLLGQNVTVRIGTDTPATIQSALESLITVRAFLSRCAMKDCFSLSGSYVEIIGYPAPATGLSIHMNWGKFFSLGLIILSLQL